MSNPPKDLLKAFELDKQLDDFVQKMATASVSYYGFRNKINPNRLFITPKQLAEFTQISVKTWERLRHVGLGPPFVKVKDKYIRYAIADLDKWFTEHTHFVTQKNN